MDEIQKRAGGAVMIQQPSCDLYNINGAEDSLGSNVHIYQIQHKDNDKKQLVAGKFTSMVGQVDELNLVWMGMSRRRVLLKVGENRAVCVSKDAKCPSYGTAMRTGPCEYGPNNVACPDGKWVNDKKPGCSEIFNLFCWDLDNDWPFVLSISRSGIKELKRFKSRLGTDFIKYGYPGIPSFICVHINVQLKKESFGAIEFYLPVFDVVEKLEREKAEWFFRTANGFLDTFKKASDGYDDGATVNAATSEDPNYFDADDLRSKLRENQSWLSDRFPFWRELYIGDHRVEGKTTADITWREMAGMDSVKYNCKEGNENGKIVKTTQYLYRCGGIVKGMETIKGEEMGFFKALIAMEIRDAQEQRASEGTLFTEPESEPDDIDNPPF